MKLPILVSTALWFAAPAMAGSFNLTGLDPSPGALWKLNRPVTLVFDQAVDFGTVNPNTVRITDELGVPAAGSFFLVNPITVEFRPDCPLEPDYSDAGFAIGTAYSILVPDNASGGPTVMSIGGLTLDSGGSSDFATPASDDPSVLFDDTGVGGAQVVVRPQGSADPDATYLELGGDPAQRVYFERDAMGDSVLPTGFLAPLNLYADLASRVAVMVELDQGVSPLSENFTPQRVRLEYLEPGRGWRVMASEATLVRNCEGAGATVRVEPRGVLPQGRSVRVNLSKDFADLVGQTNGLAQLDFGVFPVSAVTDTGGNPLELADEVLESFLLAGDDEASLADESTPLPLPRARWGDARLEAVTGFEGTSSDFDWHVPPDTTFVLDTTYALIVGGPGGVPTTTRPVIDGQVHVRDLYVPASSRVVAQGPNPLVVWATGEVRIDGVISINGGDAPSIFALNTPWIPAPGALGNGGGGRGGTGSWRTDTSTERGGRGFGAFDAPELGGEGGESGWHPNPSVHGELHRAAGGGGGVFGRDLRKANGCLDQTSIGRDAESGFPGATTANAATRPGEVMPWGGHAAPSPFTDGDPANDFWGTLRFRVGTPDERLIEGELPTPWAGAGGGAGGDGTIASVYPPPNLINYNEDRGAGGGGGGGSVQIHAIGRIVLGYAGRVEANGGHGGGGENTHSSNRIGGGSGGGAGGHVILQSLAEVDLSAVPWWSVALLARGGQGGAGAGGAGGASIIETSPALDAKHTGVSGPGDLSDNPWIEPVPTACQFVQGVVRAAGGDGGPGLVQIHVPDPRDILPPGGSLANLASASLPPPVGFSPPDASVRTLRDHLLPTFGARSMGLSKWIPMGEASVDPTSPALEPIAFLFDGTDPSDPDAPGRIVTTGTEVPDLPPIASSQGVYPYPIGPGFPYLTPDGYTLVVPSGDFGPADAVYLRNPGLLKRFQLRFTSQTDPTLTMDWSVEHASYDASTDEVALTVPLDGPRLSDFQPYPLYSLHPRYFRAATGGLPDFLPPYASVQVEFQAAPADKLGRPDVSRLFPGPSAQRDWTADVDELDAAPGNSAFRYYRFRVTFDLAAGGAPFVPSPALPALEQLRLPFRF